MNIEDYERMRNEYRQQFELLTRKIADKEKICFGGFATPNDRAQTEHDLYILYGMKKDVEFGLRALMRQVRRMEERNK